MYFQKKDLFILPFLMILPFYLETRYDFSPVRTVRYAGRRMLWLDQTKKNIFYSGLLALWVGLCCVVAFRLRGCQWCDWDTEAGSLFLQFGITSDTVTFPVVLTVYLAILWMKLMLISLCMMLIFWAQGRFAYSVIGALALTEYERFSRDSSIYIHYDFWKDFPKSLSGSMIVPAVLLLLFGTGYVLAHRKGFYVKKAG